MTAIRTSALSLALLALPLAACDSAPSEPPARTDAVDTASVEEEVREIVAGIVRDFNARDVDGAMAPFASSFIAMVHGAPNSDLAANTESIRGQMADENLDFSISDEEVIPAASGNMAYYRAAYSYTLTNPETGEPATEHGNWVLLFQRQDDGTMQITREVISDMPAPSEPKGER